MSGLCDRCNERTSQLISIANTPEMAGATRLGYRHICSACYDDLIAEAAESEDRVEDRRAEPRIKVSIKALVEGNTSHMDPFSEEMTIEEISLSGLRIRTAREIDAGALLKLAVPAYEFEASAIVQVVWKDEGQRCLGLKLVEPHDGWEKLWRDHSK